MANHYDLIHLRRMLAIALQRENDKWSQHVYSTEESWTIITSAMRQDAVAWLMNLNKKFYFYPETLFLSVAILDRFLNSVKAQPKYLKCITVSCFYIAAKTLEEDEVIPSTLDLIQESLCGCSISEIARMECCILNKLNWDVNMSTSITFLHLYYGMLLAKCPDVFSGWQKPVQHLFCMTQLLQQCLLHHDLLTYTPSTIALSIFSLHLELFWPYWCSATVTFQALIQVNDKDLMWCRETIRHILGDKFYSAVKPFAFQQNHVAVKRKVEEDDDFYDGIKRLYSEDSPDQSAAAMKTCCSEAVRMPSGKLAKSARAT